MKRSTLLLLLVIGLLAAACSAESELPVDDGTGDQPVTQGACIETEPDCEDTVAEPLPLNDDEAVSPGMGAVAGNGLTVAEAIASDLDETLAVGGFLLADADGVRLCDVLAESYPPQCAGEGALTVEGLDLDEYPVEEAEGVRWTNDLVVIFGQVLDGVLVVDQLSS